jgi:HAD superfamily hydrolase (TIGR01509 family)
MKFSGYIFDFDGLILDTESPRYSAWQELFNQYGCFLTYKEWVKVIGSGPSNFDPGKYLNSLTHLNLDQKKMLEFVDSRTDQLMENAELLPGVKQFLETAAANKIPLSIASSSSAEWVSGHLEHHDLRGYFRSVFTSRDVEKVKPDPGLYLLAAQSLQLPVESILAFEDSPNGIKAAKRAGLRCVTVPNSITREMDLGEADLVVNSMSEISPLGDFKIG